ncbi:MAG: hypothetical protein GX539_02230 [Candidatus Cloacimonetes bacterium]|jgi:hypothetical protein|nr:hypothetical protein [Candidatus Cloacimonadota bacterium]
MKNRWSTLLPAAILLACAEVPAERAGVMPASGTDAVQPMTAQADSFDASGAAADGAPVDSLDLHGASPGVSVSVTTQELGASARAADTTIRARAPAQIRGIYLNAYAAGSARRLPALLALADTTELNAFVVDVKDEKGIHYRSGLELATQLAQPGEQTIRSLSALVDTLHAHGLHAIARIVVFKDPILSKAKPEWSIRTPDGELWVDKAGNTWVSAWEPAVWDYNIAIAEEAAKAGFDEIQFDYIRFPEPYASLPDQVHPKAAGTRTEAIVGFLEQARERLHPLGVIVAADVFGLSPNDGRDINIGQQWEDILAAADHVLPMVYPSHYLPTHLPGVRTPNRMPYETVFKSVGAGMVRAQRLADNGVTTARVIPWLQAFDAPWIDREYSYGPEQAKAQIEALYEVGVDDWIFWHPGSRYEHLSAAFERTTASHAKAFEPSQELIEFADRIDSAGARAARERVSGAASNAASTQ